VMSYDGHLGFGLLADYDALPGLEGLMQDLRWAIAALARAAGVPAKRSKAPSASHTANGSRANGPKPSRKAAGAAGNGRSKLARSG
jgi:hypothetical protein